MLIFVSAMLVFCFSFKAKMRERNSWAWKLQFECISCTKSVHITWYGCTCVLFFIQQNVHENWMKLIEFVWVLWMDGRVFIEHTICCWRKYSFSNKFSIHLMTLQSERNQKVLITSHRLLGNSILIVYAQHTRKRNQRMDGGVIKWTMVVGLLRITMQTIFHWTNKGNKICTPNKDEIQNEWKTAPSAQMESETDANNDITAKMMKYEITNIF